jgi:hypothetical protein
VAERLAASQEVLSSVEIFQVVNPFKPSISICSSYFEILNLCILPAAGISYDSHSKQRFISLKSTNQLIFIMEA